MTPEFDAEQYWRDLLGHPMMGASKLIGFELLDLNVAEGWCEAKFCLPEEASNPGGAAQGGMITACLDEVMSLAAAIVQPSPSISPTLQMSVSFLRPVAVGEVLVARGQVTKRGRVQHHTEGRLTDPRGKLCATATAVCVSRPMPEIE